MNPGDLITLQLGNANRVTCHFHGEDEQAVCVYGGRITETNPMRIERHRIRLIEVSPNA